ncbi:MAG: DUF1489 domain-containing protein [Pseudomonadota bacterium]
MVGQGEARGGLHLLKVAVSAGSVEDIRRFQSTRQKSHGFVFHHTRQMPRRWAELLAGGSIYWVVKGFIQARQPFLDIRSVVLDGRPYAELVLDPDLVLTQGRPQGAFQGWRYLVGDQAPADIATGQALQGGAGEAEMPPEMRAELMELGLL